MSGSVQSPGFAAALQQDASGRNGPQAAQPSSKGFAAALAKDQQANGAGSPSGGILANAEAGFMGVGDWLKKEAGPLAEAAPKILPENPLGLRTPENTTETSWPEDAARGVGAALPMAPLAGEATLSSIARGIGTAAAAGAGSGVGQYVGQNVAPKGWEDVGGTAGALLGGLGAGAAANAARTGAQAMLPNATQEGRQSLAGKALNEMAAGNPMERPALPGVPTDSAQAFNSPQMASAVDELNQRDKQGMQVQKAGQNEGINNAFKQAAPGIDLTQAPEANAANASTRFLSSLQQANDAIKQEEKRVWNAPELTSVQMYKPWLVAGVQRGLSGLPAGLQREIQSGPLASFMQDLQDAGQGTDRVSLDEANSIRSDILAESRALRSSGNARGSAAADAMAKSVLDSMEQAPGLRGNPQAWTAYQAARDFTRQKWNALGYTPFQSLLRPNRYGNMAATPETAASGLFNLSAGAENVPGGFTGINDLLDEVKRQWNAAGSLVHDPQQVAGIQNDLRSSLQDYLISKAMGATDSTTTDLTGQANINPNALRSWIGRNRNWLSQSGIFSSQQMGLLDRMQQTSQMLSRTQNLQGNIGSQTYQRIMNGSLIDRLAGRAFGQAGKAVGTGLGAIAGTHLGVGPEVGGLVGYGVSDLVKRIAEAPQARTKALLDQALRDPELADDLMTHQSPSTWKRLAPNTQQRLNALFVSGQLPSPAKSTP